MSQTYDDAIKDYQNGYYQIQLQAGLEFQDLVTKVLYQRGIVVVGYSSRRFQNSEGENMLGAEIKLDRGFRNSGNLYIETAEKSHPENINFAPSGIYRRDNSWLFVIGDEKTIYIFSTTFLRRLVEKKKYPFISNKPTSQGYLLPLSDAEKYCILKIEL